MNLVYFIYLSFLQQTLRCKKHLTTSNIISEALWPSADHMPQLPDTNFFGGMCYPLPQDYYYFRRSSYETNILFLIQISVYYLNLWLLKLLFCWEYVHREVIYGQDGDRYESQCFAVIAKKTDQINYSYTIYVYIYQKHLGISMMIYCCQPYCRKIKTF